MRMENRQDNLRASLLGNDWFQKAFLRLETTKRHEKKGGEQVLWNEGM